MEKLNCMDENYILTLKNCKIKNYFYYFSKSESPIIIFHGEKMGIIYGGIQ